VRFTEESRHPIDPKGRVFLPKRFQSEIKARDDGERVVVLTRGTDGCLYLFTEEGADQAVRTLQPLPFAPEDRRVLHRLFYSYAAKLTLDAAGRLLLPERFRTLAGIENEVVLVGMDTWIEVWAAERWDAFLAANAERFDDLEGRLWNGSTGDAPEGGGHWPPAGPHQ
jgi:MraZ protein